MKTNQTWLTILMVIFILSACKNSEKKPDDIPKVPIADLCSNPKTVKDLLRCANSVGTVKIDSVQVKVGSDLNEGCGKAWNDKDTVLIISYSDSISLWRVNRKKNVPGNYSGHWFTNINAKAAGYTKAETLNRFALNPCPIDSLSWSNCVCPNGKQPIDAIIKYEEHIRLGPNQPLQFGVVGKSPFGDGGEMQWHMTRKRVPPYRLLEQIRWE